MTSVREMIEAISNDDFDAARETLKTTVAEYLAGKRYLSNADVFGDEYTNPNDDVEYHKGW